MGAEPFVKWAGGKRRLLATLESQLPNDFDEHDNITYVEPFVGGGAMLFHMLQKHPNIKRFVINDINEVLIECYRLIKYTPDILIEKLQDIEHSYYSLESQEQRKELYLSIRDHYNKRGNECAEHAAHFVFLNHTCFNGLYRENLKGQFNVPFGRYKQPIICNEHTIMECHKALERVDVILTGDYRKVATHLGHGYNFLYLDPPYRPLLNASNFKQYNKSSFGDHEQELLKQFCDHMSERGCRIMLSNSDSREENGDSYFEHLYEGYQCGYLYAPRVINAFAGARSPQREILITNYDNKIEFPIIYDHYEQ